MHVYVCSIWYSCYVVAMFILDARNVTHIHKNNTRAISQHVWHVYKPVYTCIYVCFCVPLHGHTIHHIMYVFEKHTNFNTTFYSIETNFMQLRTIIRFIINQHYYQIMFSVGKVLEAHTISAKLYKS